MIDYFSNFINTNTLAFPDTAAVNVTAPGNGDGTEFIAALVNDIWGRAQAMMDYAGLTPDGVQEAPGTAQILDAISKGFGVGPGVGVIYWKNDDPATNGDRILLLQGQVIDITGDYSAILDNCYVGDANNPTADAFYRTSDAAGTIRAVGGNYMVLPDTRAVGLVGTGSQTINGRVKTGPNLGQSLEDAFQGFDRYIFKTGDGGDNFLDTNPNNTPVYSNQNATNNAYIMTGDNQLEASLGKTNGGITTLGSYGTPRPSATTEINRVGTKFGITY